MICTPKEVSPNYQINNNFSLNNVEILQLNYGYQNDTYLHGQTIRIHVIKQDTWRYR